MKRQKLDEKTEESFHLEKLPKDIQNKIAGYIISEFLPSINSDKWGRMYRDNIAFKVKIKYDIAGRRSRIGFFSSPDIEKVGFVQQLGYGIPESSQVCFQWAGITLDYNGYMVFKHLYNTKLYISTVELKTDRSFSNWCEIRSGPSYLPFIISPTGKLCVFSDIGGTYVAFFDTIFKKEYIQDSHGNSSIRLSWRPGVYNYAKKISNNSYSYLVFNKTDAL